MAGNRKTVLKGFDYLHCDDFSAYLEEMASKGWHFKEWSVGLVFEKGEPEAVTYAVEVFMHGSEYDTRPEPHTKEFAEYCEAAGWKLIDAKRKFCIFKKCKEDAVDILTPRERLENIVKETQKDIWGKVALSACFVFTQWFDFTGASFINKIFSNGLLLVTALWTLLFLAAVCRCVHFYLWKHKARKMMDKGETIFFGGSRRGGAFISDWYSWLMSLLLVFYLVGFLLLKRYDLFVFYIAMFCILLLLGLLIAKFRPEADTNRIIQMAVSMLLTVGVMIFAVVIVFGQDESEASNDEVPFLYEDIGGNAGELEKTAYDHSYSVFGSAVRCSLSYEEEYIYYSVYKTEHQWILDRIWENETTKRYNDNRTDCSDQWQAESAFRSHIGTYYVRYEDAVLILRGNADEILTLEQIEIIRAALELRQV